MLSSRPQGRQPEGIIAAVMSKRGFGPGETQETETESRSEVARKTARMNTHENGGTAVREIEVIDLEMEEEAGTSNSHNWKGRLRNNKSRDIPSTSSSSKVPSSSSKAKGSKASSASSSRAPSVPLEIPSTSSKATSTSRNKKKKNQTATKPAIAQANDKKKSYVLDHVAPRRVKEQLEEKLDPELVRAAIEWNERRDRESDMAVYMDKFEKYVVATILREHFPTKVPRFSTEEFKPEKVSAGAFALAKALVNKAPLLHLAHLPSLNIKFHRPPACSPQVLAYLTYLSAKIVEPTLTPADLEATAKLFSELEPTDGPLVLLDILQDEIGHVKFITEEELEELGAPDEDIPEILFDNLLRFKDVLETDCKVFLVLFLGPNAHNSQDIVEN